MKHPLFIPEDHFRSLDVDQALEAIVADDNATIEVIEVRRCEAAPFERYERTQIRRDDRDDIKDHPLRAIRLFCLACAECIKDAQTLEHIGLLGLGHVVFSRFTKDEICLISINTTKEFLHSLTADEGDELARIIIIHVALLRTEVLQHVEILFFREKVLRLKTRGTRLNDDVGFVIHDPFDVLCWHTDHTGDLARKRAKEPDVNDRYSEHDVTHALAADALLRHFHAATVANDALVANALVFTTCAFPVPDRTKDLFAEQTILLRAEGTVVDRLRLGNLTMRAIENVIRRGNADRDLLIAALGDVMELHRDSDGIFLFSGTWASSSVELDVQT